MNPVQLKTQFQAQQTQLVVRFGNDDDDSKKGTFDELIV